MLGRVPSQRIDEHLSRSCVTHTRCPQSAVYSVSRQSPHTRCDGRARTHAAADRHVCRGVAIGTASLTSPRLAAAQAVIYSAATLHVN